MSFRRPVSQCSTCIFGRASAPGRCPWSPISRAAGATLIQEGEVADRLLFVREGSVSIEPTDGRGPSSLRGPMTLLGVEALRGASARTRTVATTNVKLCALSVAAAGPWIGEALTPARAMMELTIDEHGDNVAERDGQTGSCLARVGRFLLERAVTAPPRTTKSAIARMLHMRPETYSRSLRKLVDAGLVEATPPHTPRDIPALQKLAAGDAT